MTAPRSVAVITGSRADFGLLEPVMRAVRDHPELTLRVVAAGSHLLPPAETLRDITAAGFTVDETIPMQQAGQSGRAADAIATGRGIESFARAFTAITPHWTVVLGDRIEAFAAAAAASIAGIAVAHLHGGDRAEGIADEAMRHAITKLAHLHFPATERSAQRLLRMGERPEHVHVIGSPAIDALDSIEQMTDADASEWNNPAALILMHPAGLPETDERALLRATMNAASSAFPARSILCMAPNHDPGRAALLDELATAARRFNWPIVEHLPRRRFIALLKRLAAREGLILGNSSAGLIEAAALRLPAVNVGPRQDGRERPDNVIDAETGDAIPDAIRAARRINRSTLTHPYGDGRSGRHAAHHLASTDPLAPALLRKRCAY
ncbi:MAG: UDP-N-acetylglucosamine 2-epimerase (hydrolyzing) [Phycisphaerae bacterium]|nr:UDP-N-acetylglucosamine 2-epimerase (hydrolyzing) [Phycisphaerae bacterium]